MKMTFQEIDNSLSTHKHFKNKEATNTLIQYIFEEERKNEVISGVIQIPLSIEEKFNYYISTYEEVEWFEGLVDSLKNLYKVHNSKVQKKDKNSGSLHIHAAEERLKNSCAAFIQEKIRRWHTLGTKEKTGIEEATHFGLELCDENILKVNFYIENFRINHSAIEHAFYEDLTDSMLSEWSAQELYFYLKERCQF